MIRTRTIFDNLFCGASEELALANHLAFITAADRETLVVQENQQPYCSNHMPTIQPRWIVTSENGKPQLRMSWSAVREQQNLGTAEEEK